MEFVRVCLESTAMEQILRETIRLLEEGKSIVWATVVEHKGSTPRKAAARMLISGNDNALGSVGGGKLEDETQRSNCATGPVHWDDRQPP